MRQHLMVYSYYILSDLLSSITSLSLNNNNIQYFIYKNVDYICVPVCPGTAEELQYQ